MTAKVIHIHDAATMKEAKAQWRYTRGVLTDDALHEARIKTDWQIDALGRVIVYLGADRAFCLIFLKNSQGHVYASQA